MNPIDFASLAIVGAIVSVFVQFVKSAAGTSRTWTIVTLILSSLLAGGIYIQFRGTNVWAVALEILTAANTVYGIVISAFEKS